MEHYFEQLDANGNSSYVLDNTKTENLTGETDTPVTAQPLQNIPGYSFDEDKTEDEGLRTGTIAANGTLVRKLYYLLLLRHTSGRCHHYAGW